MFCLVYEKTGTLYSVIALHALNNTIAYGAGGGVGVSLLSGRDAGRLHVRPAPGCTAPSLGAAILSVPMRRLLS